MTKDKEILEDKDIPNQTTLEAMKELELGKCAGSVVRMDNLESFIATILS